MTKYQNLSTIKLFKVFPVFNSRNSLFVKLQISIQSAIYEAKENAQKSICSANYNEIFFLKRDSVSGKDGHDLT